MGVSVVTLCFKMCSETSTLVLQFRQAELSRREESLFADNIYTGLADLARRVGALLSFWDTGSFIFHDKTPFIFKGIQRY